MPNRCTFCVYWNHNSFTPKCRVIKGRCNPSNPFCDFTEDD